MPAYDYKCRPCGYEEEVIHSMSDSSPFCKQCGSVMYKQIRPGGFPVFKGSGFYCNDYSKDKK